MSLGGAACGATEHDPADDSSSAGRSTAGSGGSSTTNPSGGAPLVAGAGGSSTKPPAGGVPSTAGSGGSSTMAAAAGAPSAGVGGLPALAHPLIVGDPSCPLDAPQSKSCEVENAACVYRGIDARTAVTNVPMSCRCRSGTWSCVSSDEAGNTRCPSEYPFATPASSVACPPPAWLPCEYPLFDGPALAVCSCAPSITGEAGAGAEGAAQWSCGL